MSMPSESTPRLSPEDREKDTDLLTEAQRAFAKVVGQALATAWRRRGQMPRREMQVSPGRGSGPSGRTD